MGVITTVFYEQVYGSEEGIETLIAASVAVDAHLWGAISGLLFAIFLWKFQPTQ
jgi:membrane associated rhomboid family serine protease